MTSLLDLPNELLLLLAAELDVECRRRLSKTCQRCRDLIRSQQNQERYGIRTSSDMMLHQLSDTTCVLRFGRYKRVECKEEFEPSCDVHVFVFQSATSYSKALSESLVGCRVSKAKITFIDCTDALEESIKKAREGSELFKLTYVHYGAQFELLNMEVAAEFIEMSLSCEFTIYNDGFYNEVVHEQMDNLLTSYLKIADDPKKSHLFRRLRICEEFTRKCCSPCAEEMNRIDESSRSLLNRLRERKGANAEDKILQCTSVAYSDRREFNLVFEGNRISTAEVGNGGFSFMLHRKRCSFYGQQLRFRAALRYQQLQSLQQQLEQQQAYQKFLRKTEQKIRDKIKSKWRYTTEKSIDKLTEMQRRIERKRLETEHLKRKLGNVQREVERLEPSKSARHRQ